MPPPQLYRQVDHVLLTSSRPKELFALLSETFELPVVWPLSDYGRFGSGGVAMGNVNLEVIKASEQPPSGVSCQLVGLALEPEPLQSSVRELDSRRIAHGNAAPFRGRQSNGSIGTLWTTMALPEVSSDSLEVFFCEYAHDVPGRRQRFLEELRSRGGGPLGIHSVREIVCGATDVKRTVERWQKLLQPLRVSPDGAWHIGGGPAVRVVRADQDQIQELIVNVMSLEQARRFLKQHDLLGRDQPTAVTVASAPLPGFSLTLVEAPSPGR